MCASIWGLNSFLSSVSNSTGITSTTGDDTGDSFFIRFPNDADNSRSDNLDGSVLTSRSIVCFACPNIRSMICPINVAFGATADNRYDFSPAFNRSTITAGSVTVVHLPAASRATICVTPWADSICACTSVSNCFPTSARQRLNNSAFSRDAFNGRTRPFAIVLPGFRPLPGRGPPDPLPGPVARLSISVFSSAIAQRLYHIRRTFYPRCHFCPCLACSVFSLGLRDVDMGI